MIYIQKDTLENRCLNRKIGKRDCLKTFSDEQLKKIILNNNYAEIQRILGVSCTLWKKELKDRGLKFKNRLRFDQYPELTRKQITLLIGSLLGDGGLGKESTNCSRFFEGHAPNQYLYLKKKHTILKPYSCDIYRDNASGDHFCYRFTTVSHPNFNALRSIFYEPLLRGKLIPLEFIKANWHDDVLAYWFLDDGHFDERSGCYTIANKCPKPEQLYAFVSFLSNYYQAPFSLYTYSDIFYVKIPLIFRDQFIKIILNVATEDMLYKIPAIYRGREKVEFEQQAFKGSSRIEDIKNKMVLGYTLEDLQEEYPITEALFLRLGGHIPKFITMNHPIIKEIVGEGLIPDCCPSMDTEAAIGTLLGDGNIFKYGNDTCIFSFAHSLTQVSYVKLKYELFKSYVNRVRFLKNTNNNFYSFHVLLKTLPIFSSYHKLFYTVEQSSKKNFQKYVFKEEIANLITPKVLAFWVMDDGKKYGSGRYMFSITIGKQPYYTYDAFQKFVEVLNDKLGIEMRARKEKISYEITTTPGKAEEVFHKIKDYIWPYFSYKFGVASSECGQIYRNLSWYPEWGNKDASMFNL